MNAPYPIKQQELSTAFFWAWILPLKSFSDGECINSHILAADRIILPP